MEQLEKFLIEIGLSDKEAKIYIFLLTVENSNVAEVSKKTKINRTTVYPVVDSLIEKGLVEETKKDEKTHIRALSPEKIETYIEEQKIKLYEKAKVAKDMIPKFKTISRGEGERPVVEYYDGKEEILRSARGVFSGDEKGGVVYAIYPRDEVEKGFSKKDLDSLRKKRIEKNVKIISIYSYSKGEYTSETTIDRKRVDPNKYPIKAEINIYRENVRIHIFGKHAGTIFIKSIDVAETLKSLFNLAFEGSK